MQRSRPRIPADLLSILLALSSTHHVEADCVASQFEPLFFDSILAFLERAKLLTQLPPAEIHPTETMTSHLEKRSVAAQDTQVMLLDVCDLAFCVDLMLYEV